MALHQHGSNNPLGIDRKGPQDSIPFHPYYTIKDMFGLSVFLLIYCFFIFYHPTLLGDPANFIPANPLQTPPEIVPEWYLLPFYAILRSIPNKLLGVCFMFGSLLTLFILPWLDTSRVRSAYFRPVYKWVFWLLVIDALTLGYVGAHRPEGINIVLGRVATFYYFFHFYILFPLIGWFERPLPLPTSISAAVLAKHQAHAPSAGAAMEKH
jgi:ubiquinol-cytochrome c reductase cytochrome b subunit